MKKRTILLTMYKVSNGKKLVLKNTRIGFKITKGSSDAKNISPDSNIYEFKEYNSRLDEIKKKYSYLKSDFKLITTIISPYTLLRLDYIFNSNNGNSSYSLGSPFFSISSKLNIIRKIIYLNIFVDIFHNRNI